MHRNGTPVDRVVHSLYLIKPGNHTLFTIKANTNAGGALYILGCWCSTRDNYHFLFFATATLKPLPYTRPRSTAFCNSFQYTRHKKFLPYFSETIFINLPVNDTHSRPELSDFYILSQIKLLENHTLNSGT